MGKLHPHPTMPQRGPRRNGRDACPHEAQYATVNVRLSSGRRCRRLYFLHGETVGCCWNAPAGPGWWLLRRLPPSCDTGDSPRVTLLISCDDASRYRFPPEGERSAPPSIAWQRGVGHVCGPTTLDHYPSDASHPGVSHAPAGEAWEATPRPGTLASLCVPTVCAPTSPALHYACRQRCAVRHGRQVARGPRSPRRVPRQARTGGHFPGVHTSPVFPRLIGG